MTPAVVSGWPPVSASGGGETAGPVAEVAFVVEDVGDAPAVPAVVGVAVAARPAVVVGPAVLDADAVVEVVVAGSAREGRAGL